MLLGQDHATDFVNLHLLFELRRLPAIGSRLLWWYSWTVKRYRDLLERVDEWFHAVRSKHEGQFKCDAGCASCCHGLFDISLPDAIVVAEGMLKLPEPVRLDVSERACAIQADISTQAPELKAPFFLNRLGGEHIDEIVDRCSGVRCPFLGAHNECLIYEHRPLACRLEGVPMVDLRDGLFGDWCELNFPEGVSRRAHQDLQLDYYSIQHEEQFATERVSEKLLGERLKEATVFIPSLIAEFDTFWRTLLMRLTR